MLARIITKIVSWAVAVFYDVERLGPPLADGPVLVVANHPNALVDPLVVFRTGGRRSRPMAKATLFEQALVGTVLRGLGGLPVYRREDDPEQMHRNEGTFDAAIAALRSGEAVQIYPEGRSHSEPSMTPIRTGAARIATMAEDREGWALGLRIQPVGLTYSRKHLFRGRVIASYGLSFSVAEYAEAYRTDPREAVRRITDRIRSELEALTLNFDEKEDEELVDVAERLYARTKGVARFRERDRMAERLPRLQRFAAGLRWMRHAHPERFVRLRESVRRYQRLLTLFGAREGDVPPRYAMGTVLAYAFIQLFVLCAVLPAAIVGIVAWLPPFALTRWGAPRFRPKLDQVATYKLSMALLAFPTWYALVGVGVFFTFGLGWVLAVVLTAMPIVGLAAVAWRDRQRQTREDVLVFLRALMHRRGRDRLGELRLELAEEFDEVGRIWASEREPLTDRAAPSSGQA